MPLLLDLRLKWKAIYVQTHVTTKSSTSLSHPFEHQSPLWHRAFEHQTQFFHPMESWVQKWRFPAVVVQWRNPSPCGQTVSALSGTKKGAKFTEKSYFPNVTQKGASGLDCYIPLITNIPAKPQCWLSTFSNKKRRAYRGAVRVLSLNLLLIFPGKMEGYLSWYGICRILCSWRDGQLSVLQESCSHPNMCSGHVLWDSKSFWKLHCAISIAKLKSLEARIASAIRQWVFQELEMALLESFHIPSIPPGHLWPLQGAPGVFSFWSERIPCYDCKLRAPHCFQLLVWGKKGHHLWLCKNYNLFWWLQRSTKCVCKVTWTLLPHATPPKPQNHVVDIRWFQRCCVRKVTWTLLPHSIPFHPTQTPPSTSICTFSKNDATTRAVFHLRSRHKCQLRSWSLVKSGCEKPKSSPKPPTSDWLYPNFMAWTRCFFQQTTFFLVNSTILLVDSPFCLTKTSPLLLIKSQFVLVLPFFRWWNITIYIICVQSLSLMFVSEIRIYLGEFWEIHTFPSWNPTFSCINPEFCCLNHQEISWITYFLDQVRILGSAPSRPGQCWAAEDLHDARHPHQTRHAQQSGDGHCLGEHGERPRSSRGWTKNRSWRVSNFKFTGVDYDYDMLRLILVAFSLLFVAPIQTKSGIQIAWVQCEGYLENWRVWPANMPEIYHSYAKKPINNSIWRYTFQQFQLVINA